METPLLEKTKFRHTRARTPVIHRVREGGAGAAISKYIVVLELYLILIPEPRIGVEVILMRCKGDMMSQ